MKTNEEIIKKMASLKQEYKEYNNWETNRELKKEYIRGQLDALIWLTELERNPKIRKYKLIHD